MNIVDKDFKTVEDGMKKLEKAVLLRNTMGGALYWNILNDDCCEIAQKLIHIGATPIKVFALLE